MFCPMDPPIEDSVVCTRQNQWLLGSLFICEVVEYEPNDAVMSWEADGNTYCIRKFSKDKQEWTGLCDSESNRVHQAGTSAAVWRIGSMFVKVKAWRQEMQLESDIIRYVENISPIPLPKIVHSWVDSDWNRSFLVLRALEGQTLDQAWELLSAGQRMQIAGTVAQFCATLAQSKSDMLMTTGRKGVLEPFLTALPLDSEPSWMPHTLGPYSSSQLRSYLSESSVFDGHIELFHFYHADLGPRNIIVSKDGSIAGIIDWESAAFYPKFWLGTKPLVSAGFFLHGAEMRAWAVLLASALEREGFSSNVQMYKAWERVVQR